MSSKWIPVKKSVPDKDVEVIVWILQDSIRGDIDICKITSFYKTVRVWVNRELEEIHNITHWMPLPRCPEQE